MVQWQFWHGASQVRVGTGGVLGVLESNPGKDQKTVEFSRPRTRSVTPDRPPPREGFPRGGPNTHTRTLTQTTHDDFGPGGPSPCNIMACPGPRTDPGPNYTALHCIIVSQHKFERIRCRKRWATWVPNRPFLHRSLACCAVVLCLPFSMLAQLPDPGHNFPVKLTLFHNRVLLR